MRRSDKEVNEQLDRASGVQRTEKGSSRWPGMTYEEGVDAAIRWMNGDTDDKPMED